VHTSDVVKRQNNKNILSGELQRLHVIVDVHPKEFLGAKLHQTVFLTGLDKYNGIVYIVQKKALDKGLAPLTDMCIQLVIYLMPFYYFFQTIALYAPFLYRLCRSVADLK